MKTILQYTRYLSLLLFVTLLASACSRAPKGEAAQNYLNAEQLYAKQQYTSAQEAAMLSVEQTPNSQITREQLLLLANCYFQNNDMGKAVFYYRCALRYSPSNQELLHNLSIANSKITENLQYDKPFVSDVWYNFVHFFSPAALYALSMLLCALLLASILLYFLGNTKLRRQIGFYSACAWILLFILSIAALRKTANDFTDPSQGVVVVGKASVKSAPESSAGTLADIHEGSTIHLLTYHAENGWWQVILPNGNSGWISSSSIWQVTPYPHPQS